MFDNKPIEGVYNWSNKWVTSMSNRSNVGMKLIPRIIDNTDRYKINKMYLFVQLGYKWHEYIR